MDVLANQYDLESATFFCKGPDSKYIRDTYSLGLIFFFSFLSSFFFVVDLFCFYFYFSML